MLQFPRLKDLKQLTDHVYVRVLSLLLNCYFNNQTQACPIQMQSFCSSDDEFDPRKDKNRCEIILCQ